MLEGDKHDNVPAPETHEIGSEAFVERNRAFFGNHAADHTWNRFSAAWLSIHNSCFEHIDGRTYTYSDETGAKRARYMRDKTVGHTNSHSHLLKLIVGGELCCVDDRVAHNVRTDSNPKATNTVLLYSFLIAVHTGGIGSILRFELALSLHADLNQIRWICN